MLITVDEIQDGFSDLLSLTIRHVRQILLLLNSFSAALVQFIRHNGAEFCA